MFVALSQSWPDGHRKAGAAQPGTHAPAALQRFPSVQSCGEHVEVQRSVFVSQTSPLGHALEAEQAGLQRPSDVSHDSPPGQPAVVQSTEVMHCDDVVSHTPPSGQPALLVQPGSQDNVTGEHQLPTAHPVTEQSGGAGTQASWTQRLPYPQSLAWLQPAAHRPEAQCEP